MATIPSEVLSKYPRLTPRVIDVWIAVLRGKSNKGMAREFGLSENTINAQLGRLYRELDLVQGENNERVMAVRIALGLKD